MRGPPFTSRDGSERTFHEAAEAGAAAQNNRQSAKAAAVSISLKLFRTPEEP